MRSLIGLLVLTLASVLIQNADAAAVMSVDFGSEWMKVSGTNKLFTMIKK
jgi:hypothetical protein